MSHTTSSSTEIGDEVLAKFTAPVNPQTLESINSPARPHSHPFLRFLRRRPAKALAHQLSQSLPHGYLPQALQSLLTCHLHQFTMNPSSRIYRETTKDGEMTVDLDAYRAMTGKEFHGQRIPVHISDHSCEKYNTEATDSGEIFFHSDFDVYQGMDGSELAGQKVPVYTNENKYDMYDTKAADDGATFSAPDAHKATTGTKSTAQKIPVHISDDNSNKYNIDAVSEDKKITALREKIAFLKHLQETQETIHKSELVSLQVSLATALSKIETLERQYIAPLQAAVTTLDGENKILRWDHNRRIAAIQANEEAVTKKNDSVPVEGGTLGAIGKQDKGVQLKGLAVLLGFFFLLAAIFATTQAGSGYIEALKDWVASVGRDLQEMAEAAVDGSWGTLGYQAVDGRHL